MLMEIWVDMLRKEGGIQKLVTHTRSYPLFLKSCPFPFLSSNILYAFKMAGRPTSRDPQVIGPTTGREVKEIFTYHLLADLIAFHNMQYSRHW